MLIWKKHVIAFIAFFAGLLIKDVLGALYEFVPDNEDFFQDCPNQPNVVGINDVIDLSNMKFAYDEGRVTITGNVTSLWEGVEPTDRLEAHAELYKFQFGDWQQTVFSLSIPDFCEDSLDVTSIVYQVWTTNVFEEDRLCLNNYGHVYRVNPSEVNTTMEFPVNMEGRYKGVGSLIAYDQMNVKREKIVCVEIPGSFYKLQ